MRSDAMSKSKPMYYARDGWVHKRISDRDLPVCRADHNQVVRAKMIAKLMNQGELVPELVTALESFVAGFMSNPGTPDLDDEQLIILRFHLGDWRKARAVLAKAEEGTSA